MPNLLGHAPSALLRNLPFESLARFCGAFLPATKHLGHHDSCEQDLPTTYHTLIYVPHFVPTTLSAKSSVHVQSQAEMPWRSERRT